MNFSASFRCPIIQNATLTWSCARDCSVPITLMTLCSPELIQRVGYVPCCVEGSFIGSDEGERGNLRSGAYAKFLAQSKFFNRLGYVKFQCSTFVGGESGFLEPV